MADRETVQAALGEEALYPAALTARCELLELLSLREGCTTLLARERDGGRLLVVRCYEKGPELDNDEEDILKRLHCAGLPAFAGVCESEGLYCVLREYIPGETLDRAARKGLTEARVREIGLELCRILRYLHTQEPPVIHRDIKPQNIVLTETGEVCLIDFGISRRYSKGAASDTVISGTQEFAPPEQYGFTQTDCRSDIFSLGVLLNWLMTGSTRIGEGNAGNLKRCIRRCMAFDPRDRYQNVDAVARALRFSVWRKPRLALFGALLLAVALGAVAVLGLAVGGAPFPDGTAVRQDVEVTFREPLIEEAVRLALDKGSEEAILPAELERVEGIFIVCGDVYADEERYWQEGAVQDRARLDAADGGVHSLEDLRRVPNLRSLCVSGGSITDLSPLEELTKLETVDLRFNQVRRVDALAGLPALWLAGFNGNPVEDITPLGSCPSLGILDLVNVPGLTGDMLARAVPGPLAELRVTQVAGGAGCLSGCEIRLLEVKRDLSLLEGVLGLEQVRLFGEGPVDLSVLTVHTSLREVWMPNADTGDLAPLLELPELERVTLSRRLVHDAVALGEVPFEIYFP